MFCGSAVVSFFFRLTTASDVRISDWISDVCSSDLTMRDRLRPLPLSYTKETNMLLEKIKTPGLSHLSYLIGSGGKAAVIDPRRDCECYVEMARAEGLEITDRKSVV